MANTVDIMAAVGRSGLSSDAAASASASASGLAARVREWARALGAHIDAEVQELESIAAESRAYSLESWRSQAAVAFREALVQEQVANATFQGELETAATSTRHAGESIGASLDALAATLGGVGALIDNALLGMSQVEGVLDDAIAHADRSGLTLLQNELQSHLTDPLLNQVAGALSQVGR